MPSLLRPLRIACLGAFLGALTGVAVGQTQLDRDEALRFSQTALGRQVSGEYRFTDIEGRSVALGGLRGSPVVVSLIYTSCYHTCPLVTEYLAEVVAMARQALGESSFRVLTIGFDTANDNPVRMRQFARERGIDDPLWQFLSADAPTLAALASDLGFTYVASAKGFDHLAQATVLDREGRVYRQVYGDRFPAPALVEPLKELVFATPPQAGLVESLVNEVNLFCTVFDPSTGRYRYDYSIFVGAFVAFTCMAAVAVLLVRTWRQAR
jgi:protein SCO1/2